MFLRQQIWLIDKLGKKYYQVPGLMPSITTYQNKNK